MNGSKRNWVEAASVDTDTNKITLSLRNTVAAEDIITLDYTTTSKNQDKGVIEDLAGNDLETIKGVKVVNNTIFDPLPTITSAEIDGNKLDLTISEDIKETVPKASKFKVMNGSKRNWVEAASVDTDTNKITLTLRNTVASRRCNHT